MKQKCYDIVRGRRHLIKNVRTDTTHDLSQRPRRLPQRGDDSYYKHNWYIKITRLISYFKAVLISIGLDKKNKLCVTVHIKIMLYIN